MSSNNELDNKQNQEIEFGEVFKIISHFCKQIGKAFMCLWATLVKCFFALIDFFFIYFLKKYYLFVVACFVVLVGFYAYSTFNSPNKIVNSVYKTSIELEPNYGSGKSLYAAVVDLDNNIQRGDLKAISKTLQISRTEAASLVKLTIEPSMSPQSKLSYFNELVKLVDTNNVKYIKDFDNTFFDKLMANSENYDYPYQKVTVYSTNDSIFRHLTKGLLETSENIKFVQDNKTVAIKNLVAKEARLKQNISDLDSLFYKVMQRQDKIAAQPSSSGGLTLNMSDNTQEKSQTPELEVLNKRMNLTNELAEVEKQKIKADLIIITLKDFSSKGLLDESALEIIFKKLINIAIISLLFGLCIRLVVFCYKFVKNRELKK